MFAAIDQMGGKLLRCVGLDRPRFLLTGKAATYNPRRLCSLKACGVVAFWRTATVRQRRKERFRAGKSPPGRGDTGKIAGRPTDHVGLLV
ncbi:MULTISPECIES: hypothetical protein [Methylococcus]|uniref:hypothetical protein n=1 Tax=Methylococcus TaxID=413 RepID=UPI0002F4D102|nr:hypothetical protein [Methylococcus capsulatus]QXP95239.1 hypothetical protein KW113_05555 [Methylococcus capsulatus]